MKALCILTAVLLPALFFPAKQMKPFRMSGYAQGTTYHITYYAEDSIIRGAEIAGLLDGIDSSLSVYKPYSLISQFNKSQRGWITDAHLRNVILKAQEVNKKTGGIFDITIQPLVQAWGFGTIPESGMPDSAGVRALMKCAGPDKIRLRGDSLIKTTPCTHIDVNGIAQGYSVDVLADYFDRKGIKDYLVEIGGEIRVRGRRQPSGQVMTVGIEGPSDDLNPEPLQKVVLLKVGALTTSGNYRKFYQQGGKRISHLIDARTGFPIQNELISVTVWADDAITADGYDNALMGMGLSNALRFVSKQKKMEAYFIYRKEDGSVGDTATLGFYKLMK